MLMFTVSGSEFSMPLFTVSTYWYLVTSDTAGATKYGFAISVALSVVAELTAAQV